MVLAPRLEISQKQKLMMNPQLRQAIALLQLTNAQLNDLLKREMEQNPFLAFDENHYRDSRNTDAPGRGATVRGTSGAGLADDVVAVRVDFAIGEAGDRRQMLEQTAAPEDGGLMAHMVRQIGETFSNRDEAALAVELAGWLDEDGILREDDAEICSALDIDRATLGTLLVRLQAFSPAGLFARDLADCLRLQLAAQGALTQTHEALLANLKLLAAGDFGALAAAAGITADELPPYLRAIRALDPRPAAQFDAAPPPVETPDIIVLQGDAGWQAYLNEATLPSVLVLERDWEEMATRKITDDERSYMKSNVQSARWLRKATQQRAATLLRVARAIVARQQAFFDRGMIALKPMVLRDIAEVLELHESTVSRSAAGKLAQTPGGLFYLKDLFSTGLGGTHTGSNTQVVSAAAIKARLAQLISAEDAATAVLSDDAIVACLAQEGINLARRTVAKYRKALNIASSVQRRRAAKIARMAGG